MPMSTDVNLPKSHVAVFPDRCIACGASQPGDTLRICTHTVGWWTVLLLSFGKRFCIDAPICHDCRTSMIRQRWSRRIVNAVCILVAAGIAVWLLSGMQVPLKRWILVGLALVCLTPLMIWEVLFPPPLDLTAFPTTVDYEFRDKAYAVEFAALNNASLKPGEE